MAGALPGRLAALAGVFKADTAIAIGNPLHRIGMAFEADNNRAKAHYFYSRAHGVNATTTPQYREEADPGLDNTTPKSKPCLA